MSVCKSLAMTVVSRCLARPDVSLNQTRRFDRWTHCSRQLIPSMSWVRKLVNKSYNIHYYYYDLHSKDMLRQYPHATR